jgi:hypothetical protein
MTDREQRPPRQTPARTERGEQLKRERDQRRAEALRQNLKRRKAWSRAVAQTADTQS